MTKVTKGPSLTKGQSSFSATKMASTPQPQNSVARHGGDPVASRMLSGGNFSASRMQSKAGRVGPTAGHPNAPRPTRSGPSK